VQVAPQVRSPPQVVDKLRQGHCVRLEPVLGVFPARRDFTLGREVDDVLRPFGIEQIEDLRAVGIDVKVMVAKRRQAAALPVAQERP